MPGIVGLGAAAFLAGLDKFFNLLTQWEMYLSPLAERLLPMSGTTFMHVVGVIEMIVGLMILTSGGGTLPVAMINVSTPDVLPAPSVMRKTPTVNSLRRMADAANNNTNPVLDTRSASARRSATACRPCT